MSTIVSGEWQNALFISSALFVIVVTIEATGRRYGVAHESTRKAAHVLCGIGLVLIPWQLTTVWGPLVFAGSFTLFMAVTKKVGLLQSVHGVARKTTGATLYPVGVLAAFFLLGGNSANFKIAVLLLALGDAAAAICGRAFGRRGYRVFAERRSVEGSIACLLVCFVVMVMGLSLSRSMPALDIIAAALIVSALVSASEALSPRGSDNLVMPIIGALLIRATTTEQLILTALALSALAAGVAALGRIRILPSRPTATRDRSSLAPG